MEMNFIIQIFLGYLLADLITSTVHWFEDTYIDYNTNVPFLQSIAKDNAMHHFYPRSILTYNFFETIGNSLVFGIVLFGIIYYFNKKIIFKYPYFFAIMFSVAIISNYLHKISHKRDCELNPFTRLLTTYGIIMSHTEHQLHHSVNSSDRFSVNNNYMNYIYDNIGLWRILEHFIFIATGIKPCHKPVVGEFYGYYDDNLLELVNMDCPKVLSRKELYVLLDNNMKNAYANKKVCSVTNGKIKEPIPIPKKQFS